MRPSLSLAGVAALVISEVRADVNVTIGGTSYNASSWILNANEIVTVAWSNVPGWDALLLEDPQMMSTLFAKSSSTTSTPSGSPVSVPTCTSYTPPFAVQSPGCYYPSVSGGGLDSGGSEGEAIFSLTAESSFTSASLVVQYAPALGDTSGPSTAFGPFSYDPSPMTTSPSTSTDGSNSLGTVSSTRASSTAGTSSSSTGASLLGSQTSSKKGLSTGAKAGIAVGAIIGALAILLAAFFIWRRAHQKKHNAVAGVGYSQARSGTDRNLHAEKEMNVINNNANSYSPVEHHGGFDEIPVAGADARGSGNWADEGNSHAEAVSVLEEPYHDTPAQREQSDVPGHEARYAGMSPDEQARWDEEEARIDEAIAAAERRRH